MVCFTTENTEAHRVFLIYNLTISNFDMKRISSIGK